MENGDPYTQVKQEMQNTFQDSLIVTHNGASDFASLDLDSSNNNWQNFDLQWKFLQRSSTSDKYGQPVMQPIGLRRLVLHYFGIDIQSGVHDEKEDAKYTMLMFHKYQELARKYEMTEIGDKFDIDEFIDIKKFKK